MDEEEEKVSNEIENRKKLSPEAKEKIVNSVFYNSIFAIIMSVIVSIINITYNKLALEAFETYVKILQMFVAVISIVLFEVAYKKDTMKIGLFAIEFLIFSIAILFVPYMYILQSNIKFLIIVISAFLIYYVVKSIASSLIIRFKFLKENMSDVKEIVKDEKQGYLDEESHKTLKMRKLEDENKVKLKKVKKLAEKEKDN